MKNTYTRTLMIEDLTQADVTILLYEGCKYLAKSTEDLGKEIEVHYTNLSSWTLIDGGVEAEEFEKEIDESSIDEFHEYLILTFNDGTEATFRNSHCDMFLI